jgi:phosphohistidine swiveling domain-containing protein
MEQGDAQNYLSSVDWEFYLEREQPLFVFAAFARTYGPLLKEASGIGFAHQLYYFKGERGVFYRDRKEMGEVNRHFARTVENGDRRIMEWLDTEERISGELQRYASLDDPEEILSTYLLATLYNPTIVYRLQACLADVRNEISSEFKARLERSRSRSFYTYLVENVVRKLFVRAARRLEVPERLASLLTPEELLDVLLRGKEFSERDLKRRENGCFFFLDRTNSVQFHYGTLRGLGERAVRDVKEFAGKMAFKGNARGIVSVVNSAKNMGKFKEGEILVSINTNPSLMPILRKAAAIVTDEGGIACHAAIISRELGIPCIIGTKIATRVLTDGDEIEVDADNAIVRLLQRA